MTIDERIAETEALDLLLSEEIKTYKKKIDAHFERLAEDEQEEVINAFLECAKSRMIRRNEIRVELLDMKVQKKRS
jgi:hypothetical protein